MQGSYIKMKDRIISFILAVLMVISLIQIQNIPILAADESSESTTPSEEVFSITVINSDGSVIAGARVVLQNEDGSYVEKATTDDAGIAKFEKFSANRESLENGENFVCTYQIFDADGYLINVTTSDGENQITANKDVDKNWVGEVLTKATVDTYAFYPYYGVYDGEEHDALLVESIEDYTFMYNYNEEEDLTEIPKIEGAGEHKITVQVLQNGTEVEVVEITAVIEKAEREFAFEKEEDSIEYANAKDFVLPLAYEESELDGKTISYSIIEQKDLAGNDVTDDDLKSTIDDAGKLSINTTGTLVIQAEIEESTYYKTAIDTYTLTINKSEQTFKFSEDTINVSYGTKTLQLETVGGESSQDIIYSIINEEDLIAIVDANGLITFNCEKTGTFTVQAEKSGDDKYKDATVTCDVVVVSNPDFSEYYELVGTKNDDEWFTGIVTIKAKEGYSISEKNSFDDNDWKESLEVTESVENKEFFLKNNESGAIGSKITITIKIDAEAPTIEVTDSNNKKIEGYYNIAPEFNISIIEDNFDKDKLEITVTKTDSEGNESSTIIETYTLDSDGSIHKITDLDYNFEDDAKYTVKIECGDICNNSAQFSTDFVFDKTEPEMSIDFDNKVVTYDKYYNADRNATVIISDNNFELSEDFLKNNVAIEVSATDVEGKDVSVDNIEAQEYYTNLIHKQDNWVEIENNSYKIILPFTENANYTFNITCKDLAGNAQKTAINEEFCIDKGIDGGNPKNLSISYSESISELVLKILTFGFYKAEVTVEISAEDEISGIDYFTYSYKVDDEVLDKTNEKSDVELREGIEYSENGKKATAMFSIPAEFRGKVSFTATDMVGNTSSMEDEKTVVVDSIEPVIDITYDNNEVHNGSYYDADRIATITIDEANFWEEKVNIVVKKRLDNESEYTPELTFDDLKNTEHNGDIHTGELFFDEDADYEWSISYADESGNKAIINVDGKQYKEKYDAGFTIDKKQPEMSIESIENNKYYNANQTAIVKIDEHNFELLEDYPKNVQITVKAFDVQGKDITSTLTTDYQKFVETKDNWTQDGDVYTIKIPFTQDAHYTLDMTCEDLAGNGQLTKISKKFCIDKNSESGAPTNLKISYSAPWDELLLETITFGFYQADVTVTISAEDEISGIDYFTYSYEVADDVSTVNKGKSNVTVNSESKDFNCSDKKNATVTFKIPPEFRGKVSFAATDMAGNTSSTKEDEKTIVVDSKAPVINVTYDNHEALNVFYYDSDRTATIKINEANFWDEDVKILVKTRLNEEDEFTTKELTFQDLKNKKQDGDIHTGELVFDEDADYEWSINYTDKSGNIATEYKMAFTIDKTQPEMSIEFDNDNVVNDRYYNANRTATVTITEHNFELSEEFLKDNVVITIIATDVQENDFTSTLTTDYQKLIENKDNWTKGGDAYTINIPFTMDANYELNMTCSDLAGNGQNSAIDETFCIDKESETGAPENLEINYSKSFVDIVLETISFGFYQADLTVTISAEDEIAGIDYFIYTYEVSEDVSTTNTGKSNVKVDATDQEAFKYSENNKKASVTFKIAPQFRGYVSFYVTDKAGNRSEIKADKKVVVVDNKAPIINVTYDNANSNEVYSTYYNTNRTAAIKINEANFWESDVEIVVEKRLNNESEYTTTELTFEDLKNKEQDGDVHTGEWSFDEEADYKWSINYKDKSGNVATAFSDEFTIDKINPVISISYSNNSATNSNQFKADRVATIQINEHNFKAGDLDVNVTAKNAKNENVSVTDYATYLKNTDNWEKTGDVYTTEITFNTEANYIFSLSYTDMAGNNCPWEKVSFVQGTVASREFTIDKTIPYGKITAGNWPANGQTWNKFNNNMSFSLWTNEQTKVSIENYDDLSGIDIIEHFRSDEILTAAQVKASTEWVKVDRNTRNFGYVVQPDERFVVYVHMVDKAGNECYLSSDGMVVDKTLPNVESIAPDITIIPEAQAQNGIFKSNVNVSLKVSDPIVNNSYSGLKSVSYEIYNNVVSTSEPTQQGVLYTFDKQLPQASDLTQVYEKNNCIIVDSSKNNSNNVTIKVIAEDNSGNIKVSTKDIQIDTTAPEIDITYSNNSVDSEKYFKENRTATIVVTERNFNPQDVVINITNTDGVIPAISEWRENRGTGNLDNSTWTATINYSTDGDYTFEMEYADKAGNVCEEPEFAANTIAPTEFTIDKTIPVVNVSYDNNSASNDNYYSAERIATISVTEHNFVADRVIVTMTATDDGAQSTVPVISGWSANGDVHTATIVYREDSLYSFDVAISDMAGNEAEDFAEQSFYVDKTAPEISITGVANNSANNGNVVPVVTFSDTNFDLNTVKITLVGANRGEVSISNLGSYTDIHNGRTFTFANFAEEKEIDDIYTLTVELSDKAGNSTTENIVFSVNRFGSTYALSAEAKTLNGSYVREAGNIVLTEVNANALENIVVTLFKNNQTITLVEGTDYEIAVSGGNGSWYQYVYTIYKQNFVDDGVYRLSIHSEDHAGNVAENTLDTKGTEISFGVDKTNPNVIVTNLESGKAYEEENILVKLLAEDNLVLSSIIVYLDDFTKEYKSWNAEQIAEIISANGEFSFDISGDSTDAHNLMIVCTDAAGNQIVQEIEDFYVTTNAWVIYFNNKPLFFGTIGGVVALLGGAVTFIVLKRRKKERKVAK